MTTYRVDVNPDVLVWARSAIGLSVENAAKRLGVPNVTLMLWEVGADELAQPTLVQLRNMAELYQVPLAALYFEKPPATTGPALVDFRVLGGTKRQEWSLELHRAYRRALLQQQVSRDIASARDDVPQRLEFSVGPAEKPEATAESVRRWLSVSLADQLTWKDDYQALRTWTAAVERKGILVVQAQRVAVTEMRGFSLSQQPFPVIVLNGSDAPRAKIFTLIHELIHVLSSTSGLCTILPVRKMGRRKAATEEFCNEVAAAVLLPLEAMTEELEQRGVSGITIWSDGDLQQLARKYKVSREVVLGRFVTLGRASVSFLLLKLAQFSEQYEKAKLDAVPSESGPRYARMVIRNLGRRYTRDVIQAFDQRLIDAAELTDYLSVKVESLPKIMALLDEER